MGTGTTTVVDMLEVKLVDTVIELEVEAPVVVDMLLRKPKEQPSINGQLDIPVIKQV
jgi:hypothetical protein